MAKLYSIKLIKLLESVSCVDVEFNFSIRTRYLGRGRGKNVVKKLASISANFAKMLTQKRSIVC